LQNPAPQIIRKGSCHRPGVAERLATNRLPIIPSLGYIYFGTALAVFALKDRFDVSCAVKHADDLDTIRKRQVEDHIAANEKAAEIRRKLRPSATHIWLACQCL